MLLFNQIDDAEAIVRLPKGVFRQVKMYNRGDRVFVAHNGGFIRITSKFGSEWGTSHPDIKVIDFDCAGVNQDGEPRYVGANYGRID